MTDYERALQAGAAPKPMSDYDRALAAGAAPKATGKPQEASSPGPAAEEPGFFMKALQTATQGIDAVGQAGGDIISSHGAALLDPSKRHQLERGLGDVLTGGLANKAADYLGNKFGDTGAANLQQTEASDQEAHPEYRTAGNIGGAFLPSPFNYLGGKAAHGLGEVVGKPVGKLAGASLGAAKGLLGYETSAVPLATVQAATQDQNPIEAAREASKDPLGLLLGVGGGAVGGAAHGKANALRDTRNLSGRTLKAVEAGGGTIKSLGEPVSGGIYETPELAGAKHGRQGVNDVAGNVQEQFTAHNRATRGATIDEYGPKLDEILNATSQKTITPKQARAALEKMREANKTSDGKTINAEKAKMINHLDSLLSTTEPVEIPGNQPPWHAPGEPAIVGEDSLPGYHPDEPKTSPSLGPVRATGEGLPFEKTQPFKTQETERPPSMNEALSSLNVAGPNRPPPVAAQWRLQEMPHVKVEDLIKVKQEIKDRANFKNPNPTPEEGQYRELYGAILKDAEAVDPRIAPMNAEYGATMERLKRANDLVYSKNTADIADRAASEKAGAAKFGRVGDETQAATPEAPQMDELRAMDPKYAEMLRLIEAKKAQERLRYGEPEASTSIEKGQHRAAGHLGRKVVAAVTALASGHPALAIPAYIAASAFQNPMATDLRLKLPVLEGLGPHITGSSGLGAIGMAREAERKRIQERDARLADYLRQEQGQMSQVGR